MSTPRILVAGIGNIFFGDDAFGVEVAQRLLRRPQPEGVRVVDFGIRGLDLAYALLNPYEAVILVDAVPRGGQPGTLYLIEPERRDAVASDSLLEAHSMDPVKVLRTATALGGDLGLVLLVGCEPQTPADAEDVPMEMSDVVRAAVDEAVPFVESLVLRLLQGEPLSVGPS